jgi:DNA-directed RNA polymerase subunit omega
MLKPSYSDLMNILNKDNSANYSRYSIVMATARRARQLVEGAKPYTERAIDGKPVTTAIYEIFEGYIGIASE